MAVPPQKPRRGTDPRAAAEALFRPTAPKPAEPEKREALPGVKETVTLRLDQDVLAHFQDGGPGWQDRINAALRAAIGK